MTLRSDAAPNSKTPEGRSLVGRAREIGEISRALSDVEAGRGRLVTIAGEPGIGKTSLADHAMTLAEERGLRVRWGRCWEAGGAPAYWPWLGVLSSIASGLDDAALSLALGDGAPVLVEILPELRSRLPPQSSGASPPPEEARFRVFRAIVALVREASRAERHGLAIALDDLHAADRSSLLLLHFVARELRGLKVLLIATYRDVEARTDAETSELIARIGREGTALTLSRLDARDAAEFVAARAGDMTERVSGRIVERAQGNPLFLGEMLRLYAEEGAESIEAGVVPHGVRDVIGQRLSRVSPGARSLLELAAVAGDEIDAALLASAGDGDVDVVAAALSEATRAGVLVTRRDSKRFGHALFREVLDRDLLPDRKRELHGRIAKALLRLRTVGVDVPEDKLAFHALEGPDELLAAGIEHAVLAAERARELLAYDDAVETLERALTAVTRKGNPALLRAKTLIALAEACIRRGDDAAGKRHCREAVGLARSLGDADLAARATLVYGRAFTFGNVDPVLVDLIESSLEALPPGDSALRARLLGRLAAALQPSTNVEEPVEVARTAIATARRLDDKRTLLEVLHDSISAMMDCAPPAECLLLNLEAERLCGELGDRERLLRTHGRLFFLHLSHGDFALADRRIEDYETLAQDLAAPWLGFRSRFFRAVRATMHGRFAEAEAHLSEALRLGTELCDPITEGLHLRGREALLRASERHDELLLPDTMARKDRSEYRFGSMWKTFHNGLAHARREEVEPTEVSYRLLPDAFPQNLFSYFFMVEMAAVAGTKEQAEWLLEKVSACPDEYLALSWTYVSWEGPRSRFLALLLARLERWEEASREFEDAIARLEKLEALPYLTRTEYEYARMLLLQGGAESTARARSLLDSARRRAEPLGMAGLVRHIDRRLADMGGEHAPARTAVPARSATVARSDTANPASPSPRANSPVALVLEGEYFSIAYRTETFRLKDSVGLRYIARLLEAPGREIHVLDLVRERQGATDAGELADDGDAGELLDDAARESYRRRLEDLKETLAEAESFGDRARANRTRQEMEFLAQELSRAVGLGGRSRKAGAAAERARSAVQRRIRHAIERVKAHSPALAEFLDRSVSTGNYCVYIPVPD